ncbi:hypothetical protein RRG08_047736 [Elysia crispata]|uniref:Uncharacterized protein n=1 Tax=Elysia crispata TaxID=231223 RepID=A0AAE1AA62_9GAST|nr:hypothetical protein RRG08_047736 [Elysia crispata]
MLTIYAIRIGILQSKTADDSQNACGYDIPRDKVTSYLESRISGPVTLGARSECPSLLTLRSNYPDTITAFPVPAAHKEASPQRTVMAVQFSIPGDY